MQTTRHLLSVCDSNQYVDRPQSILPELTVKVMLKIDFQTTHAVAGGSMQLGHALVVAVSVVVISVVVLLVSLHVSFATLIATAVALFFSAISVSIAILHRFTIVPRFVQISLWAAGKESDKKYRVIAEVMNIGGKFADKCACEVMRIVDETPESLQNRIQLGFVPIDTPAGKLNPLVESPEFSMSQNTRIRLRNYIPESLREEGRLNLQLKLEANGVVRLSDRFGLPDWTTLSDAQKRTVLPSLNAL
jgi:uncharacterized Tic20 family protein